MSLAAVSGFASSAQFESTQHNLASSQAALATDVARLSSGLRINTAADDPSGLAISSRLGVAVAGYHAANNNIQEAQNAMLVADGAMATIIEILSRIRTLALQASNDLLSAVNRSELQTEATALLSEINTIAVNTTFNGVHLLDANQLQQISGNTVPQLPGASVAGPPVTNPLFGSPNVGSGSFGSFQYNPISPGWTFVGRSGISGINSGFTSGAPPPPVGTQVAFIQSAGGSTGSVSQSISGFTTNTAYTISFTATQRRNFQSSGQTITVTLDGNLIARIYPTSGSYTSYTTEPIITGAGTHTLTFTGNGPNGQDNTAFITDIKISGTPVPQAGPSVPDSGFEQVPINLAQSFGAFAYDPTGSSWTFVGQSGVSANRSGFTSSNPNTPSGGQVGLIQQVGSMYETVNGFQAGVNYQIAFLAANRANSPGGGTNTIQILVDGTVEGTFTPTSTNYTHFLSSVFTPSSGSHQIEFRGLNPLSNDETSFIDQIQIYAGGASYQPQTTISIQSAANEGQAISLALPDARASTLLGIGRIDLSTTASSQQAIGQIDNALAITLGEKSRLGAISVALSAAAQNDQMTALNLTASESLLRDTNIAATTTKLAHDSLLVSVGNSVLSQSKIVASDILQLFRQPVASH